MVLGLLASHGPHHGHQVRRDAEQTNVGNWGGRVAEDVPWHDQLHSAELNLPPLGVVWLTPVQAAAA